MMVREICYLQFRFICEIIALACLIAHGDIRETQAIRDTYEPGKILKKLERLNPYFYPQPMELIKMDDLKRFILKARPNIKHLGKKELPILWGSSGNFLHRSPMVKMLEQKDIATDNYSDIFNWSTKLTGLLNCHWITLVENKKGMLVTLKTKETNKAAATIFDFDASDGMINATETWIT